MAKVGNLFDNQDLRRDFNLYLLEQGHKKGEGCLYPRHKMMSVYLKSHSHG